jgi:hypothetical protein
MRLTESADSKGLTFPAKIISISPNVVKGVLFSNLKTLRMKLGIADPQAIAKMTQKMAEKARNDQSQEFSLKNVEFAALRAEIQRTFDKKRLARVGSYAGYIRHVEIDNGFGGTPLPTLAILASDLDQCEFDDQTRELKLPFDVTALLVDGETQVAARYELMKETAGNGGVGHDPEIAFTFYLTNNIAQAKQVFHDYNALAMPVAESMTFQLNYQSPVKQAIDAALDRSNQDGDKAVNWRGNTVGKGQLTTRRHLMFMGIGLAFGVDALNGKVESNMRRLSSGSASLDVELATRCFVEMMAIPRAGYPTFNEFLLAGVAIRSNPGLSVADAVVAARAAYEWAKTKATRQRDWPKMAALHLIGGQGRRAA